MTAHRSRGGVGLVVTIALLMVLILGSALVSQGFFQSSVAEQVGRSLRTEEAADLAESVVDETIALVALEANGGRDGTGRSRIFHDFRTPSESPVEIGVKLDQLPASRRLLKGAVGNPWKPPKVEARIRHQKLYLFDKKEHDDRYGLLEVTARVPYRTERGAAVRECAKWVGFRAVRLGLPAPFDQMPLFVHRASRYQVANVVLANRSGPTANDVLVDAARSLERAPEGVAEVIRSLQDREREVAGALARVAGTAGQGELPRLLDEVRALIQRFRDCEQQVRQRLRGCERHLRAIQQRSAGRPDPEAVRQFDEPFELITLGTGRSTPHPPAKPLEEYNLPARARRETEKKRRADDEFLRAKSDWDRVRSTPVGAGSVEALRRAAVGLAGSFERRAQAQETLLIDYRDFQRTHFEQPPVLASSDAHNWDRYWSFLESRAFAGGIDARSELVPGRAQFAIQEASSAGEVTQKLNAILGQHGSPFQGIVHVRTVRGGPAPLRLDGTKRPTEWWNGFTGRIVLVVEGDCELKEVRPAGPDDLLVVICSGKMSLGGTVQAGLVAHGCLSKLPDRTGRKTRVVGALILGDQVFGRDCGAPEDVLEDLVFDWDPRLAWSNDRSLKPISMSVVLGPVPAYVASVVRD